MLHERYEVRISADVETFEFESTGPNGIIKKVIAYTEINVKNFFNLGFGDKDPETGFISDLAITNNNDSKKVLATVAATLYAFTDSHPGATVIATGSTGARTRLYQMGIANNFQEIEKDFEVAGLIENEWKPFRRNVQYGAFLVRRKA